jgi:flavin reductase (DIM6/NTAB) family NADH-FMN oxidoreductase RutF
MDRPIANAFMSGSLAGFASAFAALGGVPVLAGAAVAITVWSTHRYRCGDHTLVVGRVEELEIDGPSAPLLYYEGRYAGLQPAREARGRSPEPYPSFF